MKDDNGLITILVLLIMTVVLTSALFLIYTYYLEYKIANSSENSIQSSYIADSKIKLVLYDEKYYYNELLPRINRYIQYGWIPSYNVKIILDSKDLVEGDKYNAVYTYFSKDDESGKLCLELSTSAVYKKIRKEAIAKYLLINEFFEMGIPIVSPYSIREDKRDEFDFYMNYLQNEIKIPSSEEISVISANDYEKVKIIKGIDDEINIQFFRNNIHEPIKIIKLLDEDIFLISNNDRIGSDVYIETENELDNLKMSGILYIDGNLNVCTDFDFFGILIINGNLSIQPNNRVCINGIVLTKSFIDFQQYGNLSAVYNFDSFRKYGIYLPKFIDPTLENLKSY